MNITIRFYFPIYPPVPIMTRELFAERDTISQEDAMRVSVTGHRVRVTTGLREYIDRRLYFALGRFGPQSIT